jgi:RNA polymerase sigma-70 factor (sigma-E family)
VADFGATSGAACGVRGAQAKSDNRWEDRVTDEDPGQSVADGYTEYVVAKSAWLRKIAFLLCQDWHRADDLVQTSITKLYINWRRARDSENLDGYVRAIVVNTFLSEQRSPWWRRVTPFQDRDGSENPAGGAAGVGAGAGRDLDLGLDLGDALAAIPPRQRAAVVLRFYCDLSVEETAAALHCSAGTVKSQTARGPAALRRRLAPRRAAR